MTQIYIFIVFFSRDDDDDDGAKEEVRWSLQVDVPLWVKIQHGLTYLTLANIRIFIQTVTISRC